MSTMRDIVRNSLGPEGRQLFDLIERQNEALDLAEGYIRAWADRGDEGAKATLRMIAERRNKR